MRPEAINDHIREPLLSARTDPHVEARQVDNRLPKLDSRRALEEDSIVLVLKSGGLLAQLFVDVLKLVDSLVAFVFSVDISGRYLLLATWSGSSPAHFDSAG